MAVIEFMPQSETELDIEEMDLSALRACKEKIQAAIMELDQHEPEDEDSEEYELWGEEHEDLEDLLDDIIDRMEELTD